MLFSIGFTVISMPSKTEEQPRNNRNITRDITREITRRGSLERLFYWFFHYFPILTILIFEPLLEPFSCKAVREKGLINKGRLCVPSLQRSFAAF